MSPRPGPVLQARLLDNQKEGTNTERFVRLRKALGDVPNADLFGTDTIPTVEIPNMENRPRGMWMYTAVHGVY